MKTKGLTLIELIAVLALLAVVALITAPIIFSQLAKGRDQLYNDQVSIIEDAAHSWASDHTELLPNLIGNTYNVTVEQLQQGGYLDSDFKSTKTKQPFPPTSYVEIRCTVSTDVNYDYSYTYIP